jgi:hypothetical protein
MFQANDTRTTTGRGRRGRAHRQTHDNDTGANSVDPLAPLGVATSPALAGAGFAAGPPSMDNPPRYSTVLDQSHVHAPVTGQNSQTQGRQVLSEQFAQFAQAANAPSSGGHPTTS